ncbi:MAG: glycosyltransferase [Chitinispirillaceae bacterium]|nr:glycosyltransferase [Chitinispirillaceae bacterium]
MQENKCTICFFNSVKFWGGGEKLHLENAIHFRKRDYKVVIASRKGSPLSKKAIAEGFFSYPVSVSNLSFFNPFKIIQCLLFYKRHNIDTVIFSASQDLKLGSISAKLAGVKNIVYLRGLASPVKADLLNILIFKSFLTHIILNSQDTKRNTLKRLGKYVNGKKVHVIYHGIDVTISDTDVSERLPVIREKGRGIILGNAGRLTAQKGQVYLIRIASILKKRGIEFTLFVAGTGELQSKLESLRDEYGLQQEVVFTGFIEDIPGFMNSIDIFLFTSLWEGFGFALVEAMIAGKPVVAFNATSNPEIVTSDITGFLTDCQDLEMFADKTITLIKDPLLRKKMGEAAAKSVRERFEINERITELEQCLFIKNH